MVEPLLRIAAGREIANQNRAAGLGDALHLAERCRGIEEVVKREARDNTVKRAIGKGKIGARAELPGDVGHLLLVLVASRALKHGGNEIEPRDVAREFRKKAGDDAGAASHVENSILRMDLCAIGHQIEQRVITVAVALREWLGLPRELVEDNGIVLGSLHKTSMALALA